MLTISEKHLNKINLLRQTCNASVFVRAVISLLNCTNTNWSRNTNTEIQIQTNIEIQIQKYKCRNTEILLHVYSEVGQITDHKTYHHLRKYNFLLKLWNLNRLFGLERFPDFVFSSISKSKHGVKNLKFWIVRLSWILLKPGSSFRRSSTWRGWRNWGGGWKGERG